MKKYLLLLGEILLSISIYSQGVLTPLQDWSTTSGTQNFFHKNITKTDASSNVYVAGATLTAAGDYDILLTKTNSQGTLLWTKQDDGSAHYHDMATDVVIDASGNVYITGTVCNDVVHHYSDCITIKYNSSGTQQWLSTYNGTGSTYDAGAKVIEDGSGNVYVCGGTVNASLNRDFLVLKYNSSGTQQWVREYNGTANMDDAAIKCAIVASQLTVLGVSPYIGWIWFFLINNFVAFWIWLELASKYQVIDIYSMCCKRSMILEYCTYAADNNAVELFIFKKWSDY